MHNRYFLRLIYMLGSPERGGEVGAAEIMGMTYCQSSELPELRRLIRDRSSVVRGLRGGCKVSMLFGRFMDVSSVEICRNLECAVINWIYVHINWRKVDIRAAPALELGQGLKNSRLGKMLMTLNTANGEFHIDYISKRTGIPEATAYEMLQKLADEGFITKCSDSSWSSSLNPRFEFTPKGRERANIISEKVVEVIGELL